MTIAVPPIDTLKEMRGRDLLALLIDLGSYDADRIGQGQNALVKCGLAAEWDPVWASAHHGIRALVSLADHLLQRGLGGKLKGKTAPDLFLETIDAARETLIREVTLRLNPEIKESEDDAA